MGVKQRVVSTPQLPLPVKPPVKLGREAMKQWNSLRQTAIWLKASDALALADYCRCWERLQEAESDLSARGQLVAGRDAGLVSNPSLRNARSHRASLQRYSVQLGLHAGAARVQTPGAAGYIEGSIDDPVERALCGEIYNPQKVRKQWIRKM
jgi:P27 family predicted phage terminase small subunit